MIAWRLALFGLCASLSACLTIPSPSERRQIADEQAARAGWQPLAIVASPFVLASYVQQSMPAERLLTIYIEGDGAAWFNRWTPAADPTPVRATGLALALRHQHGAAAYLARPCQFVAVDAMSACQTAYWTDARFAPEVIAATHRAVDVLKQRYAASRLVLVGYSGGGAVAALLASQRRDVERLVTVAGNLDHATWTGLHQVTPLTASLNPADAWQQLMALPQVHFVGGKDEIVDGRVAAAYVARFTEHQVRIVTVKDFDHACCWADAWPRLQAEAFSGR